jgi:hypothetical protein
MLRRALLSSALIGKQGPLPRYTEALLYKGRAAVEREFGPSGTNGRCHRSVSGPLDRVRLDAVLTILAKLACALARGRITALEA